MLFNRLKTGKTNQKFAPSRYQLLSTLFSMYVRSTICRVRVTLFSPLKIIILECFIHDIILPCYQYLWLLMAWLIGLPYFHLIALLLF